MSTTMSLTASGVTVVLGGVRILDEVDVTVSSGEMVALVGPNGAGKSTLLSVLSGDLHLDAGSVELDGRPLTAYRARELARRRAVLLQKQGLAFGFRVQEVVRMGRSPWHRTSRAEDDDAVVDGAIARVDATAFADRLFPTLSGGEQARTTFARVLAQEAPVLLLDEPTAALDIRHQEALLDVALQASRAGAAVVVVLHDLSLAAAYADRVVVLSAGRVAVEGRPREVLTDAILSAVYDHPVRVVDVDGALVVLPVRVPRMAEEAACVPLL